MVVLRGWLRRKLSNLFSKKKKDTMVNSEPISEVPKTVTAFEHMEIRTGDKNKNQLREPPQKMQKPQKSSKKEVFEEMNLSREEIRVPGGIAIVNEIPVQKDKSVQNFMKEWNDEKARNLLRRKVR